MECQLKNYLKHGKEVLKQRMTVKNILCLSLVATIFMGVHTYNETEQLVKEFETSEVAVLYKDHEELAVFDEDKADELSDYIDDLSAEARDAYNLEEIIIEEDVAIETEMRSKDSLGELKEMNELKSLLEQDLTLKAKANVVYVEGDEVAKIDKNIELDELMELIAQSFIPEDGELENVEIQEDIQLENRAVAPEKIMDKDTVVSVLLDGAEYIDTYEVESGDSLWAVAEETGQTVSQLREANPRLDEDEMLRPGEELELEKTDSHVNVNATETRQVKESISYDTEYRTDHSLWWDETKVIEPGETGEREVEYRIIKENGEEKDREVVDSQVIEEPENKVVLRGTSERPRDGGGRFLFPIDPSEGRITSGYGPRGSGFHGGVDFAASAGTPIRAADSGVVTFSGSRGAYGNLIIIEHDGGYETHYAHNSENHVAEGESVNQGDVIGLVGTTGRSTGAHLHFEIHRHGSRTDPLNYFEPR